MKLNKYDLSSAISHFILQIKLYKWGYLIILLLSVVAIAWGVTHTNEIEEQQSLPMAQLESNSEHIRSEGKIVYSVDSAIRPYRWKEVITGDVLFQTKQSTEQSSEQQTKQQTKQETKQQTKQQTTSIVNDSKYSESEYTVKGDNHNKNPLYIVVQGITRGASDTVILHYGHETQVMGEGESWQDITVLKISNQRVLINRGGKDEWLEI